MTNLFSRVYRGAVVPFDGLKIIFSSKQVFSFALIPFLIGIAVFVGGIVFASEYLNPYIHDGVTDIEFLKFSETLTTVVSSIVSLFSWLAIFLLNFFVGYLVIIVLGGPFYALMVENLFKKILGTKLRRSTFSLFFRLLGWALMKILLFSTVGLFCFILSFFPGMNLLAPLVVFMLVAFDCTDYAFEVDFLSLRSRFQFFFDHFWEFLGLALMIMATSAIPGAFFILLPAFICGATKMYIQLSGKEV